MAHQGHYILPESLLEVLFAEDPDILRLLMERLLNLLMLAERRAYLQAAPYQRPQCRDQANGFNPKTLKARLGPLELRVPQVRQGPGGGCAGPGRDLQARLPTPLGRRRCACQAGHFADPFANLQRFGGSPPHPQGFSISFRFHSPMMVEVLFLQREYQ